MKRKRKPGAPRRAYAVLATVASILCGGAWLGHKIYWINYAPLVELEEQVNAAVKEDRFKQAVRLEMAILRRQCDKKGPASDEALNAMGRLADFYSETRDWDGLASIEKALRADPPTRESLRQLSHVLELNENFKGAEKALRQALKLASRDAALSESLGNIYFDEGRYKKASSLFHRCISLDPHSHHVYMKLASACQMAGDYPCALQAFIRAKKTDPQDATAYIQEGYFQFTHSDLAAARASFKDFNARYPNSPMSYHHLGSLEQKMGRPEIAFSYYLKALGGEMMLSFVPPFHFKNADASHTLLNAADDLLEQKRFVLAVALDRLALVILPQGHWDWFRARDSIADLDRINGFMAQAHAQYEEEERYCLSHDYHPRAICFGAWCRDASLSAQEGRLKQAESLYKEALSHCPAEPGKSYQIYLKNLLQLGSLAAQLGHIQEAAGVLKKIATLHNASRTDMFVHAYVPQAEAALHDLRKAHSLN